MKTIALLFFAVLPAGESDLRVGEGAADITPPAGTELAGFHKPPGQERRVTGIRQPASARALVLSTRGADFAIVSLDVCAVSQEFCRRVTEEVARKSSIPAANVRIAASHTHSMPTLRYFRQWGRLPEEYAKTVAARIVDAVELARKDLSPSELWIGKERVSGGNFNRTSDTWKTDDLFTKESTDDERWLDTTLHALRFVRQAGHRDLVWYQFSAHPVCYTDGNAGPDWPGLVAERMKKEDGLSPSFLQGHCGDVNPGTGSPHLGIPEKVSDAVLAALRKALKTARRVKIDGIRQAKAEFQAPLDLERHKEQLERYRSDPEKCTGGEWVDAGFAREWYEVASRWDLSKSAHGTPVSALALGDVALFFHPGELYSYYGLAIRRDSPFADTIVVGYTDDLIGYVPDPRAYQADEYAAVVVPKIMDLPRYKPDVGRRLTAAALELLKQIKN
jgi:neutral/alkaline ceramidase-like enzyme